MTTTTILRRRLPTLILNVRSGAGTPKHTPPTPSGSVSDNEWELRTGRAIFLIQETLPLFFTTGLVTSVNRSTGAPRLPSSSSTSPFYIPPIPTSFLEFDPLDEGDASEDENVYSPTIHLSYTPPVQLPVPFPKTFHVEGLSLYLASSSFIRHTMNALYSDLAVSLDRVSVLTNPPPADGEPPRPQDSRRVRRDKSLRVRQLVTGVARVSGSPSEWEVESTYTFSPETGYVQKHVVDSILPAPHLAVYTALRTSLGKALGLHGPGAPGAGTVCKGDQ